MSKDQQSTALFDPSLHYFCNLCRKSLKESIRVIAKLNQQLGNFIVNLCPPCLGSQRYAMKVQQYYVCKKVNRPLDRASKVTASQALQAIRKIQQEGIEQMFLRGLNSSDKMYNIYKDLNKQVFKSNELKMKINFDDCKIPVEGIQKEKPNPPNRKHLKALGYSWERQEFSFQPEISFGYLMSCLEEQEEQTQEDLQLRNIIYSYYDKEIQVINQVNEFLVNSPFLLARKAIYELRQVPQQLSDLRQIEIEIKEIVATICSLSIDEENTEKQNKQLQKIGKKHKNNKHQKQDNDDRSRTRQKKQKKRQRKPSLNVAEPQIAKKYPELIPQPPEQITIKDLDKSQVSESGSASESTEKRKRGRPKGSKSKVKAQRRKRKDRIFQLKMDIGNKIGNKRERIDQKREDKEREEGQFKRRRKLGQNNDDEEQDENYDESQDDN